ncbi:hypothetical protein AGLY_018280 [Aphis glycines]|uniref:Uncharacterized protein n=1 Tax=Aphis glycines TaxID=307491 RepID=A0A6G0SSS9_APHGL|nr:hypothetical protein AGLY_018280 [Aphis glycines]
MLKKTVENWFCLKIPVFPPLFFLFFSNFLKTVGKCLLLTCIMHQGYSLFHRKPTPKFEIEALYRLVMLYTDTKKNTSFIFKNSKNQILNNCIIAEEKNALPYLVKHPTFPTEDIIYLTNVFISYVAWSEAFDNNNYNIGNIKYYKIVNRTHRIEIKRSTKLSSALYELCKYFMKFYQAWKISPPATKAKKNYIIGKDFGLLPTPVVYPKIDRISLSFKEKIFTRNLIGEKK